MWHRHRRRLIVAGLSCVMVTLSLTGCTRTSHAESGSPTVSGPAPIVVTATGSLTAAEQHFGASAKPDPRVRYQSDVVLIGQGAAAVKDVASDGLSWTMDAADPDVARLRVGSIMVATSLGTGRVVKLARIDRGVLVVLAPVALTDVVSDLDLRAAEPVALNAPLYYSTPDRPGIVSGAGAPAAGATAAPSSLRDPAASASPLLSSRQAPAGQPANVDDLIRSSDPGVGLGSIPWPVKGSMLPPVGDPTAVDADKFSALPICCSGSTGLSLTYDHDGARLILRLELQVSNPSINFHLKISGGRLTDAAVSMGGVAGVNLSVEAATKNSTANFTSPSIEVPVSITLPLFGTPIPMTATITQAFNVSLQLGGAAYIKTHGSIGLTGSLGFGVVNGTAKADASAFTASDNPVNNIESTSIAASALAVHWGVRTSVGIGVQGFQAGGWYQLTTGFSLDANGMAAGNIAPCVEGAADVSSSYGVGYSIPRTAAQIINAFLTVLNVKPIAATGGPSWGPNQLWQMPLGRRCGVRAP